MKRFLGLAIGLFLAIGFTSSAEATIRIKVAEVQNGTAFIQGSAEKRSPITWEGQLVTSANPGGQFSFNGVVPADCVGTLSDGTSTIEVVVLDCTPVATSTTKVLKTGQIISYATGDDGQYQAGATIPNPRFTDNGNGTVTDNLTGLIWLKNANCSGPFATNWQGALDFIAELNSTGKMSGNDCGDTSNVGSHQADWRLPNINELLSLVDWSQRNPAVPPGLPFTNLRITLSYWSSTTMSPPDIPNAKQQEFSERLHNPGSEDQL
jgi:hypothetical protein